MSHRQFESELVHLELVVRLLVAQPPLGLPYWRSRIVALASHERSPAESKRVGRLLTLLDAIELAASNARAGAVVVSRRSR